MNIELVRLTEEYKPQLIEMVEEWKADIDKNGGNTSPWAIFKNDCHDFENYLENLEIKDGDPRGYVPDSTLFCLDKDRNIFVGAVNIRHYLNEGLLKSGGHIGDGVRPSERRKGYATAMIGLALEECRKLGIDRVLICCDKNNIGSAKSIINNGGMLENEIIEENGNITQRYWIDL
ncbi:MAG: GNAT family N-acetyltransferase [Clostridia bacterium]|nr:GNAT family N-acetyltransferase [Clostridia bacterium]